MRRYQLHPLTAVPWPRLVQECRELAERRGDYAALHAVAASEAARLLAGRTWLEALAVTPPPMAEPPDELVVVSLLPYSAEEHGPGWVRVEHRTVTGRDDRVDRLAAEAVPLLWRFAIEKFGIRPDTRPRGRLSPRCPSPSGRTARIRSGRWHRPARRWGFRPR